MILTTLFIDTSLVKLAEFNKLTLRYFNEYCLLLN